MRQVPKVRNCFRRSSTSFKTIGGLSAFIADISKHGSPPSRRLSKKHTHTTKQVPHPSQNVYASSPAKSLSTSPQLWTCFQYSIITINCAIFIPQYNWFLINLHAASKSLICPSWSGLNDPDNTTLLVSQPTLLELPVQIHIHNVKCILY